MTKTVKIAVTATAVLGAVASLVWWEGTTQAIHDLHPELDHKIVHKAHRKMVLKTLSGQYSDAQLANDDAIDATFMSEVAKLTKL